MQLVSKRVLVPTLVVLTVAACVAAGLWQMRRTQRLALENSRWEQRLAAAHADARPVVLFGDSQAFNWPLAASFGELPVFDRGVKGMYAVEATRRFERDVLPLHPAAVVILLGTNDIANEVPNEFVLRSLEIMSAAARRQAVPLILCSVLPVSGEAAQRRPRATIEELNAALQTLAGTLGASYVDFYTPLQDEHGQLAAAYSADGLHLNAAGYRRLSALLLPQLAPYFPRGAPLTAGAASATVVN